MTNWILFSHFIADFVCQTDKMAINKSHSMRWLLIHVLVYSSVLGIMTLGPSAWVLLNGLLHLVIDTFSSRLTSFLWKRGERHWFFVVIGLDQFLHTAFLLMTW